VFDSWLVEVCVEGVTGGAIGADGDAVGDHADALYDKLEGTVLPLNDEDPVQWGRMMKQVIADIAYHFNSQRLMRRYATEAYLP